MLPVLKQDIDEIVSAILMQLGIPERNAAHSRRTCADPASANRSRKHKASTLLQLRKEIAADIEKSGNDSRTRQQRMEGYWRYVNGTVTDRLAQNAQLVDQATGMRLKEEDSHERPTQILKMDHGEDREFEANVVSDEEKEETA